MEFWQRSPITVRTELEVDVKYWELLTLAVPLLVESRTTLAFIE